jgi:hypothetical protein
MVNVNLTFQRLEMLSSEVKVESIVLYVVRQYSIGTLSTF